LKQTLSSGQSELGLSGKSLSLLRKLLHEVGSRCGRRGIFVGIGRRLSSLRRRFWVLCAACGNACDDLILLTKKAWVLLGSLGKRKCQSGLLNGAGRLRLLTCTGLNFRVSFKFGFFLFVVGGPGLK